MRRQETNSATTEATRANSWAPAVRAPQIDGGFMVSRAEVVSGEIN